MVHAVLVVIKLQLGKPGLAGILKAADIGRGGLAIFVIFVDADDGAGIVRHRDDAAALVGVEEAAVRGAGTFVPASVSNHLLCPRNYSSEFMTNHHLMKTIIRPKFLKSFLSLSQIHNESSDLVERERVTVRFRAYNFLSLDQRLLLKESRQTPILLHLHSKIVSANLRQLFSCSFQISR
jgi:hypothetical protein